MNIFDQRESDIRAYCRVYPVVFDTAKNSRQTDDQGNEYIDFFAGAGVLNFGHNNERMKTAMISYLQKDGVLHSLDLHTTAKRDFMTRFVKTILEPRNMPHKIQFMGPTGTNAVEAALKLARRVTGRSKVVSFTKGFHGMTLGSLACTANEYFRGAAGVELNNVAHYPFGCTTTCAGCKMNCGMSSIDEMRGQFLEGSSGCAKPAAFLVETIQAEGGVNIASEEWMQALAQLAKDLDALLIIDEIQVGCGRTGSFFSFDDLGIDPDIVCLAKGIGGAGTPMAMNLVKPEHDKHWLPGEHTGTFRGQGLSFVAGAEALSYFEDDELMTQVKEKSKHIDKTLQPLVKNYGQLALRGKGMIYGLDMGSGDIARAVLDKCFTRGLLITACGSGGRVLKVIPPLTIPYDDLNEGLATLLAATHEVMEAL
ncbi:MAG: diaminobutyrate-2-oxoglutarate transaminase [Lentisphaeria bacterium]|jgi:diaminobutyrate-2-oxoglutarate transaminase